MRITKMTRFTALTVLTFFLFLLTSFSIDKIRVSNNPTGTEKKTKVVFKSEYEDTIPNSANKQTATKKDTNSRITETITKDAVPHKATWYRTEGSRVHRPHPTAAYNHAKRGSKLLVINQKNGKSCVVEVTDRMGNKKSRHIDLSHSAFGTLSDHSVGCINVLVKTID